MASPSPDSSEPDDPHSSFRLTIELSVGYQRRRTTLGGAWEGHLVTTALILGGTVVVLLVVWSLLHLFVKLPF